MGEASSNNEESKTSGKALENDDNVASSLTWPPLNVADFDRMSQPLSSEDYSRLNDLETLSPQNPFFECAGWMVRSSNLLLHIAQRNTALERENREMKNKAAELRDKFSNLKRSEAKVTDLENELLDKSDKLEIANDLIKEFEEEIQDFEVSEESYLKEKKAWWDQSVLFHRKITDNFEVLLQKTKKLQQLKGELDTWSSCLNEIKMDQFDNALKQTQLVHQDSAFDSSLLFPSCIVEDGKIVDATSRVVLYPPSEDSQATTSFANV